MTNSSGGGETESIATMVTVTATFGRQKICGGLCGWIELFAGMDENQCRNGWGWV